MSKSKTTIEKQVAKLHRLENTICNAFRRSPKFFLETKRGAELETRWNELMTEIRGYGCYGMVGQQMNAEWVQYCEQNNLWATYNLGDVLAYA